MSRRGLLRGRANQQKPEEGSLDIGKIRRIGEEGSGPDSFNITMKMRREKGDRIHLCPLIKTIPESKRGEKLVRGGPKIAKRGSITRMDLPSDGEGGKPLPVGK